MMHQRKPISLNKILCLAFIGVMIACGGMYFLLDHFGFIDPFMDTKEVLRLYLPGIIFFFTMALVFCWFIWQVFNRYFMCADGNAISQSGDGNASSSLQKSQGSILSYSHSSLLKMYLSIGVCLILWGVHSAYQTHKEALLGQASLKWPVIEGYVQSANLGRVTVYDPDAIGGGYNNIEYHPKIRYDYVVENKKYSSTQIKFSLRKVDRETAHQWVNTAQETRVLLVWYNPENPGQSILIPGSHHDPFWSPLIEFLMTACIGGIFIYVYFKKKKPLDYKKKVKKGVRPLNGDR